MYHYYIISSKSTKFIEPCIKKENELIGEFTPTISTVSIEKEDKPKLKLFLLE